MENTSAPQAKHFFPSGPNKFKDPRVTVIYFLFLLFFF